MVKLRISKSGHDITVLGSDHAPTLWIEEMLPGLFHGEDYLSYRGPFVPFCVVKYDAKHEVVRRLSNRLGTGVTGGKSGRSNHSIPILLREQTEKNVFGANGREKATK